ncbi:MAG TPA: sigma-70 family RNA polymerase sigma factor [Gemmatimonadaceae bacterium]|nr:sigma-70 family RNA polymerase sigma factor [Gemmatimonadaceae bacterium]
MTHSHPPPGGPIDFEASLLPILGQAYGYALRLTRNQADAEDLVQEATLHALRGLHTFEPGSLFKPWFFRILTNCHRMRWRTRARRLFTVSLDDAPELYLYTATDAAHTAVESDPANTLISRMSRESIQDAIRQLPVDYQEAAALYFSDELSYQEIAEVLNVPIGTVRSRLHRARKLLQQLLWRVAVDEGITPEPKKVVVPPRGLDRAGCEVAFMRLDDYLDRELAKSEMALVQAHLEVCALCTSEFAFEASLINGVRAKLRRIDVPQSFRSQLARRLKGTEKTAAH